MKSKRKQISKKTRFEVFKRDSFLCQYCGNHPPLVTLEVDHINPIANGGDNSIDNLVTSCFDCNRGKSDNLLSSVPKSLEEKADEIVEKEFQLEGYRAVIKMRQERIDEDMWQVADALIPNSSSDGMRRDWLSSIKKFNEMLPLHEVIDAAEIAFLRMPRSKAFPYFCGICWRKVRGE